MQNRHHIASVLSCIFLLVWIFPTVAEEIKNVPLYSGRVGSFATPTRIAVNPILKRVYVTFEQSDNVAVIDGVSNSIIDAVNVGRSPFGVAVDSEAGRIYVSNQADDTVSIIDEGNLTVLATVAVGDSPREIAVDRKRNRGYVANSNDNSVSVISGVLFSVIETVEVGKDPRGIAVNEDANEIYVVNNVDDTITVIDGEEYTTASITNTAVLDNVGISGNNKPNGIQFDPNENVLYVGNAGTNTVNVIDTETFRIISTLAVGRQPERIAVDLDTGRAYVSNRADHTVSVIGFSWGEYSVIDTIDDIGRVPNDIAMDYVAGRLYLKTDGNDVYAVDARSGRVLRQITFWGGLSEVEIDASGEMLYITDRSADTVINVDSNLLQINATGGGGRSTLGIGINNRMNEVYVTNLYDDDARTFILDGVTLNRVDTVDSGGSTNTVGIDNQRNRVYIAVGWGDKVMVVDGRSHRVIKETIQVGTSPVSVAVNAETNKIYVVGRNSNTVSVIDGELLEVLQTIRVGNSPQRVAVNTTTNRIYVSNSGSDSVSVIDGESSTVIDTIPVGNAPRGIAVNAEKNEVYVANYWGNSLSIIDGNTNGIVANVNVGRHPWGVAVHPVRDEIYITNYGEGSITVITDLVRERFPVPTLATPTAKEIVFTLTPTLEWTRIPSAAYYLVQVSEDREFTNPIVDVLLAEGIKYTIPEETLAHNNLYYWRVKAGYDLGSSDWSASSTFNVGGPSFILSLFKGLNFVSLPVKPDVPYTARTFAQELEATLVVKFDGALQEFIPYVPEVAEDADGFSIEGGQGYIVNVLEQKGVRFTGTIWTNAAPSLRHQFTKDNTVWAFAVAGEISQPARLKLPIKALQVTIKNKRTGQILQSNPVGETGKFAIAFIDMSRKSVVQAGDILEIYVTNLQSEFVSMPVVHVVREIDLAKAAVLVNLNADEMIPSQNQLLQNYPNPFNPETWIPFQLAEAADVTVRIYDITGKRIRTLSLGHRSAGRYISQSRAAYWDGKNELLEKVSSGVYLYSIEADDFSATKKLVITK